MRRQLLLAVGLVVLVALAGCGGITDSGPSTQTSPTNTSTTTATDTNTATSTAEDTEAGVTGETLTTDDFRQSRDSLLEEESFTLEQANEANASANFEDKNFTKEEYEEVFEQDYLLVYANLSENRYYLYNRTTENTRTAVTIEDETFVRSVRGQNVQYQYGETPYQDSPVQPVDAFDVMTNRIEPPADGTGLTPTKSGEKEYIGEPVTVYSVDSDALTEFSNEGTSSRFSYENATLRYYVNDDGQIIATELGLTLIDNENNITVELLERTTIFNINSTTFDDPEWLDEARNS